MSDAFIRHFIAFVSVLIGLTIFFAGYVAGLRGWWWLAFGCIFIYMIVYKLVDAGGHH